MLFFIVITFGRKIYNITEKGVVVGGRQINSDSASATARYERLYLKLSTAKVAIETNSKRSKVHQ